MWRSGHRFIRIQGTGRTFGPCRGRVRLPRNNPWPLDTCGANEDGSSGCHNLSQTYAIESQTYVLHTGSVLTEKGIDRMNTGQGALMSTPGGGSSAVFGPDGRQFTKDLPWTEEGILYADLDMDFILATKSFADACGHYSRPDLMWLGVDTTERKHMRGPDGCSGYNDIDAKIKGLKLEQDGDKDAVKP